LSRKPSAGTPLASKTLSYSEKVYLGPAKSCGGWDKGNGKWRQGHQGRLPMKGSAKVYVGILCFSVVAGLPAGSFASGTPSAPSGLTIGDPASTSEPIVPPDPITPPGNEGLLSGVTPGNLKIPSGWSLVRATDFEGTQPSGEKWTAWSAAVRTDRSHTGSKSLGGTYSADQADVGWRLNSGVLGSFSEVYLSFYEYIESQALFNDEFFLARFSRDDPFHEVILDWYWARNDAGSPAFNGTKATLYAVPQGVTFGNVAGKTATVPKGAWVQWEIHYRPNTSGASNGFIRVYKDGILFTSAENVNLNGTASMTNMSVQVGGLYTKLVWMMDYPTCTVCSTAPGKGTDYCTGSKKWFGQNFSDPQCAPTDPPLESFKRYIDDIILLKR
jgi:hypothetical protein